MKKNSCYKESMVIKGACLISREESRYINSDYPPQLSSNSNYRL